MRILVKGPNNSREVLPDVNPKMTFGEFRSLVASKTQLSKIDHNLFSGFPAKEIVVDENTEIENVLKNGDTVLVKQIEIDDEPQANVQGGSWEFLPSIPQKTGMMIRKECPRDNSCLFHAILLVCEEGKMTVTGLRELVTNIVASDPQRYDSTFLGCPPYQYQQQIMDPSYWGGAIELSIASTHYQCEIVTFDYHHLREDIYGEGENYKTRVFLIYSGDHYDAMAFQPGNGKEILKFSSQDMYAWERARQHAQFLHLESVRRGECVEVKAWRHEKGNRNKPSKKPSSSSSSSSSKPSSASSSSKPSSSSSTTSAASSSKPSSSSVPSSHTVPTFTDETPVAFHTGSDDYWECSCTLRNPSSVSTCEACGLVRGGQRTMESWLCPACTFNNEATRMTCEVCQTPAPHAAGLEPTERPPAPQTAPEALIEPAFPFGDMMGGGTSDGRPVWGPSPAGLIGQTGQNPLAAMLGGLDSRWSCPNCQTLNIANSIMCKQCKFHNLNQQPVGCAIS